MKFPTDSFRATQNEELQNRTWKVFIGRMPWKSYLSWCSLTCTYAHSPAMRILFRLHRVWWSQNKLSQFSQTSSLACSHGAFPSKPLSVNSILKLHLPPYPLWNLWPTNLNRVTQRLSNPTPSLPPPFPLTHIHTHFLSLPLTSNLMPPSLPPLSPISPPPYFSSSHVSPITRERVGFPNPDQMVLYYMG